MFPGCAFSFQVVLLVTIQALWPTTASISSSVLRFVTVRWQTSSIFTPRSCSRCWASWMISSTSGIEVHRAVGIQHQVGAGGQAGEHALDARLVEEGDLLAQDHPAYRAVLVGIVHHMEGGEVAVPQYEEDPWTHMPSATPFNRSMNTTPSTVARNGMKTYQPCLYMSVKSGGLASLKPVMIRMAARLASGIDHIHEPGYQPEAEKDQCSVEDRAQLRSCTALHIGRTAHDHLRDGGRPPTRPLKILPTPWALNSRFAGVMRCNSICPWLPRTAVFPSWPRWRW